MAADNGIATPVTVMLPALLGDVGAGRGTILKTALAATYARARSAIVAKALTVDHGGYAASITSRDEALLVDLLTRVGLHGPQNRADLVVGALDTTSLVVTPATGDAFRLAGYPARVSDFAIARGLLRVDDGGVSLTGAGHAIVNGVRELSCRPPMLLAFHGDDASATAF